jgi:hypothetical protein
MNNKKQSSVEWLVRKLSTELIGEIPLHRWDEIREVVQQAKAMHKEEIAKTWDYSLDNLKARGMNEMRAYTDFDEYYNETFGGQDNENRS